jgi:uncharacterized membrane protein
MDRRSGGWSTRSRHEPADWSVRSRASDMISRRRSRGAAMGVRRPATSRPRYDAAMFQLWLFLHVLGAIVAFGFGFYAPVYGAMLSREPQHGNWYLRASKRVSDVVIIPVALSMAVTGTLLVMSSGGPQRFSELWLAAAVVLYVVALLIVFLRQRPTVKRVIELTSAPPGPGGPPPEVPQLLSRLRLYGMVLLILVIAIVALMVAKPRL